MMINPGPWDSGLLNVQANLKLAASSAPETGPASKPLTMSLRRQEVSLTSTAETPRKIGWNLMHPVILVAHCQQKSKVFCGNSLQRSPLPTGDRICASGHPIPSTFCNHCPIPKTIFGHPSSSTISSWFYRTILLKKTKKKFGFIDALIVEKIDDFNDFPQTWWWFYSCVFWCLFFPFIDDFPKKKISSHHPFIPQPHLGRQPQTGHGQAMVVEIASQKWWVFHTLWWTNIAMENGHRNSGFSH